MATKHEIIRHVPLLTGLPPEEIDYLAESLRPVEVPIGALLLEEGTVGDRFYIVLEGQVEIIKALRTDAERSLGLRGPGTFLGEMSLLSDTHQATASARANTPLQLLEMTRADFDALLRRQPGFARSLLEMLSARLDESENVTIRELQEKNHQLAQAYEELKAAQAKLIEKEKLEAEMKIARDIQRSILPKSRPQVPGLDFGMLIEPMESVGGDFFDFIVLDDERIGLVMGDVSDHGVPAAIFMALTYSLTRVEARRQPSPGEVLRAVNQQLQEMNASGMFVTILYGVLNRVTREFQFARAGHELPLILDARRDALPLKPGRGQFLGIFPEPLIDEQCVTLPANSLLVMFTDGVTEAHGSDGVLFGEERLQAVLHAGRNPTAQAACEAALAEVRAFSDYAAQRDDITIIAVQVK
ncbi:MAG TPA: SpoIIE family protein phosphatase [Anaerolineae bacterium]|nr:SpoIIE family protein phosphatase [Anaerolineae bacterium]